MAARGKKQKKEPAGMNCAEIFAALAMLEKERGIPQSFMMDKIIQALTTAYKRDHSDVENVIVDVDEEHQTLKMYVQKNVVDEEDYVDPPNEMTLEEAKALSAKYEIGDTVNIPVDNVEFGRIAAGNGKQVIIQGLEVPEIYDGTVEIRSIAREAGSRTKMAVWSNEPEVDPIGACVGPKGQRVETIVQELRGEKIDIVKWSEDPAEFVAAALAPADVVSVETGSEGKSCRVRVPDDQLSLAIGKEGQNARLAARLTGCKIDIKPESWTGEEEE